jgi:hypothetical protein
MMDYFKMLDPLSFLDFKQQEQNLHSAFKATRISNNPIEKENVKTVRVGNCLSQRTTRYVCSCRSITTLIGVHWIGPEIKWLKATVIATVIRLSAAISS